MPERRMTFVRGIVIAVMPVVVVVAIWWYWCNLATTLLIVRHTDRASPADLLTPAGEARAQALAHVVEKSDVRAIYHSDTVRTRQTATPAATTLGITPVEWPAGDVAGLVGDIFANHRGDTILVVGHSNTVPQIIAEAGGPSLPNIADDEFDDLFVLTVCRCRGPVELVNVQYGIASP